MTERRANSGNSNRRHGERDPRRRGTGGLKVDSREIIVPGRAEQEIPGATASGGRDASVSRGYSVDQTQRGKRGHALIGSVEKGVDSHGSGAGRWEECEKGRRGRRVKRGVPGQFVRRTAGQRCLINAL